MVYTRVDDLDEIGRVLVELRTLGISQGLPHKSDEATSAGVYGRRVSSYYSPAGSRAVEERRPRR